MTSCSVIEAFDVCEDIAFGLVASGILPVAQVFIFRPYFPRRLVFDPESVAAVFMITVVICLVASILGIRLALKVDAAEALATSG